MRTKQTIRHYSLVIVEHAGQLNVAAMCRTAAGTIHDSRGISVAVRRAVLSLQDVPHGDDVVCVDPHHHRVHGRALHSDLSLSALTSHFRSAAGRARGDCRVGGRLSHRHPVSHTHAHLSLSASSSYRTSTRRLSYLHHTQPVDAKYEIRISGNTMHFYAMMSVGVRFIPGRYQTVQSSDEMLLPVTRQSR